MKLSYENNPKAVIDKLLEYHDIKTLRAILNGKARRKDPKGNNYFKIATDVYCLQREHDSKLEWAIDQIAEQANISDKTVKNHLTKFRAEIKYILEELSKNNRYLLSEDDTVSNFIQIYIKNGINWENPTYLDCKQMFDHTLDRYKINKAVQRPPEITF